MAHDDFDLLRELIRAIDDPRADIYLHIDKRAALYPEQDLIAAAARSNLHIVDPISVRWSGFSQVEAEMLLLEAALPGEYAYYHLLSGHDLPVVRHNDFYEFFRKHEGIEFVDCWARTENGLLTAKYLKRLRYYYPYEPISRNSIPGKIFKHSFVAAQQVFGINRLRGSDIPFCYGANWFSITRALAQFVVSQRAWIEEHFRWTSSPDEMFLQTLVLKSPFRDRLYQENFDGASMWNLRYVDWERAGEHAHSPYVFRAPDFVELTESGALFARKFDSRVDRVLIDRMVEHVTSGD